MITSLVSPLDIVAFAWFVTVMVIFDKVLKSRRFRPRTIAGAVQAQREIWMRNMSGRDNRLVDTGILQTLSQGNAFFASTSAIAIGGLAALTRSGNSAQALIEQMPYAARSSAALFEAKIVLLATIFVFAFFKFAWAFRLSHYTGIMIGAAPLIDTDDHPRLEEHAKRTADLIGVAADHANTGLRSFYYAIAVLTWFFHPLLFIAATTWVVMILVRREFFSRSYRIVSGQKY